MQLHGHTHRRYPAAHRYRATRRRAALIAATVLAMLALAGCREDASRGGAGMAAPAASTAASASAFPMTLTSADGQTLTLRAPARAIVSHSPGATEILFAIGAGAQVVAADEFSNYPPETARLKKVKYSDPNPEAELALQPDLVLLATNQRAQVAPFRALGLPVVFIAEPADVEGVFAQIAMLGRATGHEAQATTLARDMRTRIDAVTSKVADVQQGPRVFYELSDTLFTASPRTFIGSMLTTLKARNIAEGATGAFPQLGSEAVIAADPEVILLADDRHGVSPESVRARPGWTAISAVRNGRIAGVDPDVVNRPGPRIVEAMELLASLLYPERFR